MFQRQFRFCLLVQKGPYGVLINAIIIGFYVFVCSTQYGILYQRICLSSFVELPIFISFALVSYRWETQSIIKAFWLSNCLCNRSNLISGSQFPLFPRPNSWIIGARRQSKLRINLQYHSKVSWQSVVSLDFQLNSRFLIPVQIENQELRTSYWESSQGLSLPRQNTKDSKWLKKFHVKSNLTCKINS